MDETKRRELFEWLGCEPEETIIIDTGDAEVGEVVLTMLGALHRKVDKLMTDLTALQAAVDGLVGAEGAAAEELVALKDEVAQLTAGTITQDQIDSIASKVTDTANALTAATEAAKAPDAPPAEEPAPEPPAEEPAPAEPPAAPQPTKPVYQHLTEDPIDESQWALSGFETVPTDGGASLPLYYFGADIDGGGATGAVEGVWAQYTGAVQAVPA
jgi:outer membrane murein-binding lipoprotein Lpp